MTAVACHILARRGLTFTEMQFVDHLVEWRGTWKLEDHLTPDLNGDGSGGAPLARLLGKLRCRKPGDFETVIRELAGG